VSHSVPRLAKHRPILFTDVNRFGEAFAIMILTCPACATQYRLKDDAIPPEGRQVRCAACKHKWHQEGGEQAAQVETSDAETAGQWPVAGAQDASQAIDDDIGGGPPQPDERQVEPALADVPAVAAHGQMIAETPEPEVPHQGGGDYADAAPTHAETAPPVGQWDEAGEPDPHEEHGFAAIPAMHDEDEPHRGSKLGWIVGLILLVAAAAAAFWFLAPPELKARAGIAEAGESPLDVSVTTSDRQQLASGNELIAVSGRVINLTDQEQAVPPIRAELRDKTSNKLVYQWTIAPPARSLAPGASASFNSAEVDVPSGAELLSLRFAR
jgi:predicted Zn finger-like uncharacterized protein